jgi:hypothetical protein
MDEIVEFAALAASARKLSRASSDRGPCRYLHVTDVTRARTGCGDWPLADTSEPRTA